MHVLMLISLICPTWLLHDVPTSCYKKLQFCSEVRLAAFWKVRYKLSWQLHLLSSEWVLGAPNVVKHSYRGWYAAAKVTASHCCQRRITDAEENILWGKLERGLLFCNKNTGACYKQRVIQRRGMGIRAVCLQFTQKECHLVIGEWSRDPGA